MNVKDSSLAHSAKRIYNLDFGDLYFFDDFLITEMKEGAFIKIENAVHILDIVHSYFGFEKPYGLISNRINSYSIDLVPIKPVIGETNLLAANSIVLYNKDLMNSLELEKEILKFNSTIFYDLNEAIEWTKEKLKAKNL